MGRSSREVGMVSMGSGTGKDGGREARGSVVGGDHLATSFRAQVQKMRVLSS